MFITPIFHDPIVKLDNHKVREINSDSDIKIKRNIFGYIQFSPYIPLMFTDSIGGVENVVARGIYSRYAKMSRMPEVQIEITKEKVVAHSRKMSLRYSKI